MAESQPVVGVYGDIPVGIASVNRRLVEARRLLRSYLVGINDESVLLIQAKRGPRHRVAEPPAAAVESAVPVSGHTVVGVGVLEPATAAPAADGRCVSGL